MRIEVEILKEAFCFTALAALCNKIVCRALETQLKSTEHLLKSVHPQSYNMLHAGILYQVLTHPW